MACPHFRAFFLLPRHKTLSHWIFGYAFGWLLLISVTPLPIYLAQQRESRHPILWRIPDSLQNAHILILGGGHSSAPTLPPNNQLSHKALVRLVEGIRLKRQHPAAKLIGSGKSSSKRAPQATVLMNTAVALGIAPSDTLQSSIPYNTETEAIAYAQRFGTQTPLILVTSALHMPRALFWFQQQGIEAIPAPTDHYVKPDPEKSPYNWKPSAAKIKMTAALLHEWAGMLYAKWKTRGQTKENKK
ncbi:ElyC/SanA/YdcF family protein [Phaeodactylibacter sp.]|uniref:YdcF family protein n=1 Tax=Phaeodactylibacter sp. TaxID=1940289 RepID=UPI0025CBD754|nr:ElyC/SanA/YdcF family protein [Phaeodactylibacter sp.]MCI4647571.1 YdcF family protein [Phaeodactylibacter sp.]MCI5090806.1 YdcF family protein [Phaeodactylibacter sp.]